MPILIDELGRLTDDRFLSIYTALAEHGFGPLDQQVAQALHFRLHSVKKLPLAQRARKARKLLAGPHNAELAYELFGAYLMRQRKELVTGFLDATGVPHEQGMIADVDTARPDVQKLDPALRDLDGRFDPEDVTLYLALCSQQWPGVPELAERYRARAG